MGSKHIRLLLIALFAVALVGVTTAQQAAMRISPKDKLTVVVFDVPQLSGPFTVGPDGKFEFPLLGSIKAGGLTSQELADEIKKGLIGGDFMPNPQVTVDFEATPNKRVIITGQVQNPGTFPFAGELRLLEALMKAGSTRDDAADEVLVIRSTNNQETSIKVDLRELLDSDTLRNNLLLQDGDTIKVPKAQPVFITGYVKVANQYIVRRGTTVEQALALAGGVSERGATSRIDITRTGPDGKPKKFRVKDYKTETVQPGDTIYVGPRLA